MVANLHNLFRRAPLTDQDVRTLWGVVRALAEGPKRRR
jgi:tRNA/rRNA methyltransferase